MSWLPKSDNLFLNALYQQPSLLIKNLHKLSEIQAGDKLYFYPHGEIEREPDSYTRRGMGIFNRYVFRTYERDITHLEKYVGAFWLYYRVHVIPYPSLHDMIYTINMATKGLKRLLTTYESQTENKELNIGIVNAAIDAFNKIIPHLVAESSKKSDTPLSVYTKNYAFLVRKMNPLKDHLAKIMPLVEDSMDEILAIKDDPDFVRIHQLFNKTNNLFTLQAKQEALANILLNECGDLKAIVHQSTMRTT